MRPERYARALAKRARAVAHGLLKVIVMVIVVMIMIVIIVMITINIVIILSIILMILLIVELFLLNTVYASSESLNAESGPRLWSVECRESYIYIYTYIYIYIYIMISVSIRLLGGDGP